MTEHEWRMKGAVAWCKRDGTLLEGEAIESRLNATEMLSAELAPFPMQDGPPIAQRTAKMVYEMYSSLYGTDQSLDRLAERGGFGWEEVKYIRDEFRKRRGHDVYKAMRKRWRKAYADILEGK